MKKIDLREQFIMAYGGLRGGVGFSLVKSINKGVLPMADTFVTTVLMLVMATVWIQGEQWGHGVLVTLTVQAPPSSRWLISSTWTRQLTSRRVSWRNSTTPCWLTCFLA